MKKMKSKILILIFIFGLSGCWVKQQKEGQIQPLTSPSGQLIVEMPILKSNANVDYPVWTPTIKDKTGNIIYTDSSSQLSGYHNSYWVWDTIYETGADELWIYNSDTGEVIVYFSSYGEWKKGVVDMKQEKDLPPELIRKKYHRH